VSHVDGGAGASEVERSTLDALSSAVLAVARHLSVRDVLQTIVSAARQLIDAEYAALGVPDESDSFAEFVVDGISDSQRAAIGPLPRQHGMLGVMLREATVQRLPDIMADPRFEWWPAAHPVLNAFLGMPIMDGPDILGAIYLANPRNRTEFSTDDERLLGVLAAHAAIALTNARLYERSRELTLVEERQRIAYELHDAVAQKLFSLRLTAQAAGALIGRDPERAAAELATIGRLAAEAQDELRQVVAELMPPDLADHGLVETLRRRVALLDRIHAPAVTFQANGVRRLPARTEEAVLRVAQEALHNALRHADPTSVAVRLTGRRGGGAALEIVDDGHGFDPAAVRSGGSTGLGLASMRERAQAVDGVLRIRSTAGAGGGTTVQLEVPG